MVKPRCLPRRDGLPFALYSFGADGKAGGEGRERCGGERGEGHCSPQFNRVKPAWATGPLRRLITSRPSSHSRISANTSCATLSAGAR